MSRVLSFRDIRRVPWLANFSEIDLLSIERDAEVNIVLEALGFDTNQPILYVPSKHRDLAGHVAIGYRAVGQINGYSEYMNSRLCPLIERLIWAAQKDPSLAKELSRMIGHSVNLDDDAIEDEGDFLDIEIEDDYDEILKQLGDLVFIRDQVRGSPFNEQGDLKTAKEYLQT